MVESVGSVHRAASWQAISAISDEQHSRTIWVSAQGVGQSGKCLQ